MSITPPSSDRVRKRHVREKAVIDDVAEGVKKHPDVGDTQSPVTPDGLPIEEQVRKEWTPDQGGLPTFYK